jgi:hypothetical protein
MEKDKEVPIILGRSFLRTAKVIADMREDTLAIRVGDEGSNSDLIKLSNILMR